MAGPGNSVVIYLIQDKLGRGPFRPGFSARWVVGRADLDNLKPYYEEMPNTSRLLIDATILNFGCGCRTIAQLRRWFIKKEYDALLKFGYQAVYMRAQQIIAESKTQCVFSRSKPLFKDVKVFNLY